MRFFLLYLKKKVVFIIFCIRRFVKAKTPPKQFKRYSLFTVMTSLPKELCKSGSKLKS